VATVPGPAQDGSHGFPVEANTTLIRIDQRVFGTQASCATSKYSAVLPRPWQRECHDLSGLAVRPLWSEDSGSEM